MNLKQRINRHIIGYTKNKKRKKYWLLYFLVTSFAVCDVLIIFVLFKILLPHLLDTTPYLLPEHAQEYTHISTFSLTGPPVNTLVFSPDGKTLAYGSYKDILLWDAETGKQLHTLHEHDGTIATLAFSPDGKTLACGSKSKQNPTILYDIDTGQIKSYLSGPTSWIVYLDYSPDGNTIVGADENGLIYAWDSNTGTTSQPILGTFAFASNTKYNFYSTDYINVRWNWLVNDKNKGHTPQHLNSIVKSDAIYDIGTIAMIPGPNLLSIFLSSHSYPIGMLEFSPDGKILASSSRSDYQPFNITSGEILLWDAVTGMPTNTLRTPGWKVDTLAFSPNGKYLASNGSKRWSDSQKILIWDLTSHQLTSMIDTDSRGEITSLVFASDNKTLASGNEYGAVHLWDITGQIR
ncbi:hypothetical protein F4212_02200 [Candidatus Poribacteria bacterium]|nr:hypothetical protein [Candidatus Poribacteria bacterium]